MIGKARNRTNIKQAVSIFLVTASALCAKGVAAEDALPAAKNAQLQEAAPGSARWIAAEPSLAAFRRRLPLVSPSLIVNLEQLSDFERRKAQPNAKERPRRVGISRTIPGRHRRDLSPQLAWTQVAGGHTASLAVSSPGARALRLELALANGHPGVQFRFFENGGERLVGGALGLRRRAPQPLASNSKLLPGRGRGAHRLWSPIVAGDTAGIEIFLPAGLDPGDFKVEVSGLSHLLYFGAELLDKALFQAALSGSCNIDVACRETTPKQLPNAVAQLLFTEFGDTYDCTGTLLRDRDPDSRINYLATANHCVDSQTVAETVETLWFLQRRRCGGADPVPIVRRSLGGDLLAVDLERDFSLLQLNDELPEGVFYANWSRHPIQLGSELTTIHHPRGDIKKWSRGVAAAFGGFLEHGGNVGDYVRMVWSEGTTEPGSSGSGLFDGEGRYRGLLSGGVASCSFQTASDWYGRFDLALPKLQRWLKKRPARIQPFQRTLHAAGKGQWREFKVRVGDSTTRFEVVMNGLSGAADLYVRAGSRPNEHSFDCAPMASGTQTERCSLANRDATTYYVAVRGTGADTARVFLEPKVLNENRASGIGAFRATTRRVFQREVVGQEKTVRNFRLSVQDALWIPVIGDLNDDGVDSVSLFDPNSGEFHLWNADGAPNADAVVKFGPDRGAAQPLLGDWDGDGLDTPGVFIPNLKTVELRNANQTGELDLRYRFGRAQRNWIAFAGDWDGDGLDTAGFYAPDEGVFYLHRGAARKPKFQKVRYGPVDSSLLPVIGDWTGDGVDTVGIYHPVSGKFSLRYRNTAGAADLTVRFGPKNAIPIAGHWRTQ